MSFPRAELLRPVGQKLVSIRVLGWRFIASVFEKGKELLVCDGMTSERKCLARSLFLRIRQAYLIRPGRNTHHFGATFSVDPNRVGTPGVMLRVEPIGSFQTQELVLGDVVLRIKKSRIISDLSPESAQIVLHMWHV